MKLILALQRTQIGFAGEVSLRKFMIAFKRMNKCVSGMSRGHASPSTSSSLMRHASNRCRNIGVFMYLQLNALMSAGIDFASMLNFAIIAAKSYSGYFFCWKICDFVFFSFLSFFVTSCERNDGPVQFSFRNSERSAQNTRKIVWFCPLACNPRRRVSSSERMAGMLVSMRSESSTHFLRIRLKRSSSSLVSSIFSKDYFRFIVIMLMSRGVKSPPIVVGSRNPRTFFHYYSFIAYSFFLEKIGLLVLFTCLVGLN